MPTIGTIGLRAFDQGLVETLGARLYPMVVDGAERQVYAVDLPGVASSVEGYGGKVPVFFALPEDVYQPYKLPCYVVRRSDLTPNFARHPWYGYCRTHPDDAQKIVVNHPTQRGVYREGWSKYTTQRIPYPFDISYDLQVMARRQMNGIRMLTRALQTCRPPFFTMECYDSIGDKRLYDSGEVAVSSTSELADVADRTIAWTISFQIRGELDLETVATEDDIVTQVPSLRFSTIVGSGG
jgi:hypothetical protein